MAQPFNSFPSAHDLKVSISACLASNYRAYTNRKIEQIKDIRSQFCYNDGTVLSLRDSKDLVEDFWHFAENSEKKGTFSEYSRILHHLVLTNYKEPEVEKQHDYFVTFSSKTYTAKSEDEARRFRDFVIDELNYSNVRIFKIAEEI